jgi:hypothetical protein
MSEDFGVKFRFQRDWRSRVITASAADGESGSTAADRYAIVGGEVGAEWYAAELERYSHGGDWWGGWRDWRTLVKRAEIIKLMWSVHQWCAFLIEGVYNNERISWSMFFSGFFLFNFNFGRRVDLSFCWQGSAFMVPFWMPKHVVVNGGLIILKKMKCSAILFFFFKKKGKYSWINYIYIYIYEFSFFKVI